MKVCVIVLNFNGKELLQKYLSSFQVAVDRSHYACRLMVLDNQSSDESVEFVKTSFSSIKIHRASENRVLCSYNDIAKIVEDDILVLMNNDIRVEPDFIDPLVVPFERDRDTFFVTPRCLSMADSSYEGNRTMAKVRAGLFWSSSVYPGYEKSIQKHGLTFQGGFGAVDRKKFLELGGYDDLYLPGRLEDADLCFRAYKKGWKCLYEPRSVVFHEGGTSFHKSFGLWGTRVINWRNVFLFMWKNLDNTTVFVQMPLWLPLRFFYACLTGHFEMLAGFLKAIPLHKEARVRRTALRRAGLLHRIKDREIFRRFSTGTLS